MSYIPKAFFWFLVLAMLASFIGGWQGITKLHETNRWEMRFGPDSNELARPWFSALTLNTVRLLDSIPGKMTCLILLTAVSFVCYRLAFDLDYPYSGLLMMLVFTAYYGWIAIWLHFIEPFTPIIRL